MIVVVNAIESISNADIVVDIAADLVPEEPEGPGVGVPDPPAAADN